MSEFAKKGALRLNTAILTSKEVKTTNLAPPKKPTVGFFAGRAANEAARYSALMAYLDSGIQAAKREGHRIEWNAKFNADREYQSATGKSFDPSRRPSGGFEREKWDAAKRVYDIFD